MGPARYQPKPEEIPSGICECGCGQPTKLANMTKRSRRHFIGYPMPYVHGHGRRTHGAEHHLWTGGRHETRWGYINAYAPEHPSANTKGYVREHRLVMERHLGRYLRSDEYVHHINGDKTDNRLENLEIMSKGAHNALHAPERQYDSAKMSAAGKKGAEARWGKKR